MLDESGNTSAGDEDATDAYPSGYSVHEFARRERQGDIFREFTLDVLRRAGLTSGMRVQSMNSTTSSILNGIRNFSTP